MGGRREQSNDPHREKICRDCGASSVVVPFRAKRLICRRCEAIRKNGFRACLKCGHELPRVGMRGTPSKRCAPCQRFADLVRRRRIDHYPEAVKRGRFSGTFEEYARSMCPLWKWAQAWIDGETTRIRNPRRLRKFGGETSAETFRRRYRTDPEFNLKQRLRAAARKHRRFGCINTRLREGIRPGRRQGGRMGAVFSLLGYTPADLRKHIERQFTRGMSWDAFAKGDIHIDHVIPLSAFDLSREEDVIRAWSLPNLRPLWARDNIAKAARVEWLL